MVKNEASMPFYMFWGLWWSPGLIIGQTKKLVPTLDVGL